jgi:hypothetical protein
VEALLGLEHDNPVGFAVFFPAGWNGCYAIALARPSRWSGSNRPATSNSSIASTKPQPDGRTQLRLTPLVWQH